MRKKIALVEPNIPSLDQYMKSLEKIWESKQFTHHGAFTQLLEKELTSFSEAKHVKAVSNGTDALELALRAIKIKGEIISTPFTWVSTISSILCTGNTVKFVDINPYTLNIDEEQVEAAITSKTTAILATHVFGNPCRIDKLSEIAGKYGLKLIFDAAHAIGSTFKDENILKYGDFSCVSLHPTKIISAAEGGAVFTNHDEYAELVSQDRFFGFDEEKQIVSLGRNCKLDELSAGLALESFTQIHHTLSSRQHIDALYRSYLCDNENIRFQETCKGANFSYTPLIFSDTDAVCRAEAILTHAGVGNRRYFSPSLNMVDVFSESYQPCPISEDITKRILVVPNHIGLDEQDVKDICNLILQH